MDKRLLGRKIVAVKKRRITDHYCGGRRITIFDWIELEGNIRLVPKCHPTADVPMGDFIIWKKS
jgi:hypothetical protein